MQTSHFTGVTDALWMGTSDSVGGFNHLWCSLPVLGCARTMPAYDVSNQGVFYCSSVKLAEILLSNLPFLNVHKKSHNCSPAPTPLCRQGSVSLPPFFSKIQWIIGKYCWKLILYPSNLFFSCCAIVYNSKQLNQMTCFILLLHSQDTYFISANELVLVQNQEKNRKYVQMVYDLRDSSSL